LSTNTIAGVFVYVRYLEDVKLNEDRKFDHSWSVDCDPMTFDGERLSTENVAFRVNIIVSIGLRGSAVERQSLASVLSPSCARPVADG